VSEPGHGHFRHRGASLRFNGLPFSLDVAQWWGRTGHQRTLYGGRFAGVRQGARRCRRSPFGSFTQLAGVDQLDFSTRGVDLSISKGFALFTPYAGFGKCG